MDDDDSLKLKGNLQIQLAESSRNQILQEESLADMIEDLVTPIKRLDSEFDNEGKTDVKFDEKGTTVAEFDNEVKIPATVDLTDSTVNAFSGSLLLYLSPQEEYEGPTQDIEGQANEQEEVNESKRETLTDDRPMEDFFNAPQDTKEEILGEIEGIPENEVADEEEEAPAEFYQAADELTAHAQKFDVDPSTEGRGVSFTYEQKEEQTQEQVQEQEEEQEEEDEEQEEGKHLKKKPARMSSSLPSSRRESIQRPIDLAMMQGRESRVSGYSLEPSMTQSMVFGRLKDKLSDSDLMGFLDSGQLDTFRLPDDFDQEGEEEDTLSDVEEEKPVLDRKPYYEKYDELADKMTENRIKNYMLQKKIAMYLKRRKVENFLKDGEHRLDQLIKYNLKLDAYQETMEVIKMRRQVVTEELNGLKEKAAQQSTKLDRIFKAMQTRECNVGYGLIFTKTANVIPDKMVERLIKRQNVQMVQGMVQEKLNRIENIDRVEDNLRLADYEQLKVENRNYADKIEERDEELNRLRGKCQNTIQVLAHMREKSSAFDHDLDDLVEEIDYANHTAIAYRANLAEFKHERDRLRNIIGKMKMESGLLTQPDLLRDMAASQTEILKMQEDQEACQQEVNFKTAQVRNLRKNIERLTEAHNRRRLERPKGGRNDQVSSVCLSSPSTRPSKSNKPREEFSLGMAYPSRRPTMPTVKKDAFIGFVKIKPNPTTLTRRRR